ncbi:hypothetical protein TM1040_3849 (plasmid) [Ruegeria sp. TM1040]|nr:hypothetical protein TM1040_3849 [Ruegeria sp. TM1040]
MAPASRFLNSHSNPPRLSAGWVLILPGLHTLISACRRLRCSGRGLCGRLSSSRPSLTLSTCALLSGSVRAGQSWHAVPAGRGIHRASFNFEYVFWKFEF